MATEKIDLDDLGLTPGGAASLNGSVALDPLDLGGQMFSPDPPEPDFRLDVSRTSTGFALRLRFTAGYGGPCYRCLEPASIEVGVDAREVDQPSLSGPPGGFDGDEGQDPGFDAESPYVEDGVLDLRSWAHDAAILSLPDSILCRADCSGLCPVCGESLNDAEPGQHDHGASGDPRWAKLRELGS